ncbi:MAG TPA: CHAD domain-containing protein, partial [Silvibacterium sp.]|nr:CHAD domain-containing protein [Silvibacterium sp.]
LERLRQLTAALKQNLEHCAKDAIVDAVHDIRTGTRRIEAMLDTIMRERIPLVPREHSPQPLAPEPENTAALRKAVQRWLRLLKRIRRAAAPVRDLDVHRKLLQKLMPLKESPQPGPNADPLPPALIAGEPGDGQTTNASLVEALVKPAPMSPVAQQADDLDAWLKQARHENADPLMKAAPKWASRIDALLASLEDAMRRNRLRRRASRTAAVTALEAFARLANQMQQLDAGNLHDFRKGAKKARYMAESGVDEYAGVVGKALKKLQDEIGDWHDWLVLAEEAHDALGAQGAELIALIEAQRDRHYALAMNTAERMRGRLMGEWQAISPVRRVRTRSPRPAEPRVS